MKRFDSGDLNTALHKHIGGSCRLEDNPKFGEALKYLTLKQCVEWIAGFTEPIYLWVDLSCILKGAMYRNDDRL